MKTQLLSGITKVFILLLIGANSVKSQCTANFIYSIGANGSVSFTSTSVGTSSNTSYVWVFDDGSSSYQLGIPGINHNYSYNQTFSVSLYINDSINNQSCNSMVTLPVTVSNAPCTGTLSFSSYEASNGNVYFSNNSAGVSPASSFTFNFGDGSSLNSWPTSPHTYSTAGVYNVTITAVGPSSICNYTAVQTLTVNYYPCNLNANFTYTIGSNGSVNFQSTSTGTTSNTNYYWNFGDGGWANNANPTHVFQNSGMFSAELMITDSISVGCSDSVTQSINITGCFANVSFSMYKDSTQLPNIIWNAYTNYPSNAVSAIWSWGDGTSTSGMMFPSHTYSAAGMYNICVTVSVACGATATACNNTNIYRMAEQLNSPITIHVLATPTGIKSNNQENKHISVFPNPNNGEFEMKTVGLNEFITVRVMNVFGQEVYRSTESWSPVETSKKINLSELPAGTYFFNVQDNSTSFNTKVIINK